MRFYYCHCYNLNIEKIRQSNTKIIFKGSLNPDRCATLLQSVYLNCYVCCELKAVITILNYPYISFALVKLIPCDQYVYLRRYNVTHYFVLIVT